jgi:hypothetical protein
MKRSGRAAKAFQVFVMAVFLILAANVCVGQDPAPGTGTGGQTGLNGGLGSGQAASRQPTANGNASNGSPSIFDTTTPSPFADSSRQKRNDERQRRLVSDTQRLLALTAQLKAEVAASGAEAMTPEMGD